MEISGLGEHKEGVILRVKVIPNASRSDVAFTENGSVTVRLTAPPREGRANDQLVEVLGKKLGVSRSSVSIVRGSKSREKTVLVAGITVAEAAERLQGG